MKELADRLRQIGNNMRCHPAANGSIDCTEKSGELMCEAAAAIDRAQELQSVLSELDARLRQCIGLGLSAAEAYDSAYQEEVSEALSLATLQGAGNG